MENSNYSENFKQVLFLAEKLAKEYGSSYIGSEHLVFAMLNLPECVAYKVLCRQNVSAEEYKELFIRTIDSHCNLEGLTLRTKDIIQKTEEYEEPVTRTDHLLLAIINSDDCIAMRILRTMGVDGRNLSIDLASFQNSEIEEQ